MSQNCGIEFNSIDPAPWLCPPDDARLLFGQPDGNYYLQSWANLKECLGIVPPNPEIAGTWGAPNQTLIATLDQYGNVLAIEAVPISIDYTQVTGVPPVKLVGDISGTGPLGSDIVTTLANTGIIAGVYGSATQVPMIRFDAKGRAITAQNVLINIPFSQITDGTAAVNNIINLQKGVAGGLVPLGPDVKIDIAYLPDSILGNVIYKGTYNGSLVTSDDPALNGLPLPAAALANKGYYFIATAPFTYGGEDYAIGDWIISDGAQWSRVENSDAVFSVFGRIGNVVAVAGDYHTDLVPELSGAINQYFTAARARNAISATNGVSYDALTGIITHADTSPISGPFNFAGAQVLDSIVVDGFGHVVGITSRNMTASDIGASSVGHTHSATFTGDIAGTGTISGSIGLSITNGAVTYAKIQNVTSKRLLGRYDPAAGIVQEITLDPSLTLSDAGILSTSVDGSVTSVGLSLPSELFSVSGSPVTSSGILAGTFVNKSANLVFAGPATGGPAQPTFRALTAADMPSDENLQTVTDRGRITTRSIGASQGRFSGWYTAGDMSGPATEIGFEAGEGHMGAYDRTTAQYLPLNIFGSNIDLQPQGGINSAYVNGNVIWNAANLIPSVSPVADTVVLRNGAGYIFTNYLNSTDDVQTSGVTGVMVKVGDNYIRTGTAAAINAFLGFSGDGAYIKNQFSSAQSANWWISGNTKAQGQEHELGASANPFTTERFYGLGGYFEIGVNSSGAAGNPPQIYLYDPTNGRYVFTTQRNSTRFGIWTDNPQWDVDVAGLLGVRNHVRVQRSALNTESNSGNQLWNSLGGAVQIMTDAEFRYGTNGLLAYNNSGGSAVQILRENAVLAANVPNTSGWYLRVQARPSTSSGISPGLGGVFYPIGTVENRVIVTRIRAYIPVGYVLNVAANEYGNNAEAVFLTDNFGTGKWQDYIVQWRPGDSGTFSTVNYFWLDGPSADIDWYIAFFEVKIQTAQPWYEMQPTNFSTGMPSFIYINDINTYIQQGSNNSLRVVTNFGYTDIGAQNADYSHLYTDRPSFVINKPLILFGSAGTITLNGEGDVEARLFRTAYPADSGTTLSYFLTQNATGAGADNYARPASIQNVRDAINAVPSGNYIINQTSLQFSANANISGDFRWQGRNSGNPRSLMIGWSGGEYGSIGYGISYNSGGGWLYAVNDYVSALRFTQGGFDFLTAPSGTAGNSVPFDLRVRIRETGTIETTKNVSLSASIYNESHYIARGNSNTYPSYGFHTIGQSGVALYLLPDGSQMNLRLRNSSDIDAEMWHSQNTPYPIYQWTPYIGSGVSLSADNMPTNSTTFIYSDATGGSGVSGPAISFGGFNRGTYQMEFMGGYQFASGRFFARVRNGDVNTWNPWREFWHTGNLDPAAFAPASGSGNYIQNQFSAPQNGYAWVSDRFRVGPSTTHGAIGMEYGGGGNQGYLEFFNPGLVRTGYIGYFNMALNYMNDDGNGHVFRVYPAYGSERVLRIGGLYGNGVGGGLKFYNYQGLIGDYDTNGTAEKIIWTIGDSWSTIATMYGLGYTYESLPGASVSHNIVIRENGTTWHKFDMTGNYYLGKNIQAGGIIRAGGWYEVGNMGSGPAAEVGYSSGTAYFHGYNRSSSQYITTRLAGGKIMMTDEIRTFTLQSNAGELTYGTWWMTGFSNGWTGLAFASAAGTPTWMFDAGATNAHGGLYYPTGLGWALYYNASAGTWHVNSTNINTVLHTGNHAPGSAVSVVCSTFEVIDSVVSNSAGHITSVTKKDFGGLIPGMTRTTITPASGFNAVNNYWASSFSCGAETADKIYRADFGSFSMVTIQAMILTPISGGALPDNARTVIGYIPSGYIPIEAIKWDAASFVSADYCYGGNLPTIEYSNERISLTVTTAGAIIAEIGTTLINALIGGVYYKVIPIQITYMVAPAV